MYVDVIHSNSMLFRFIHGCLPNPNSMAEHVVYAKHGAADLRPTSGRFPFGLGVVSSRVG